MHGGHCLISLSKTQAILDKSSAEAELYAVVRGAIEGFWSCSVILYVRLEIQMHIDAAAAKGIIERQGLSTVRHFDVWALNPQ